MSATYYGQNALLNTFFGEVGAPAVPVTWYIGLSTDTPDEATGACTELSTPSAGGYTRIAITNDSSNFTGASDGEITNATYFEFPISETDWGTITDVLFFDASTGGNLWFYHTLPTELEVPIYSILSYLTGQLTISNGNP